ncbi:MAG TPA: ribosomal protein S18-alanine N-acetyltransferase [Aquabacterium sp.]|nr:ribosomal protein S18-alanine N-acetyltransferase [Aquabacterium sp.]HRH28327.1 ribosomal protein S18-alanine N-acetyltransferase [Aquabacterium sp.]
MRVLVPQALAQPVLRPMTREDIPAVRAFEQAACADASHAWSEENYRSSLSSGYWLRVCTLPGGQVVGVCVAMFGVDELHLLNIAVDRACQGQGLASFMLDRLVDLCRAHRLATLWLEVRPSNARARALYERHGYAQVGLRKNYYPALDGREDAVVMRREVALDAPLD